MLLSVYNAIKDLIDNEKKRKLLQDLSIKNFFHTNKLSSKKMDDYRKNILQDKTDK